MQSDISLEEDVNDLNHKVNKQTFLQIITFFDKGSLAFTRKIMQAKFTLVKLCTCAFKKVCISEIGISCANQEMDSFLKSCASEIYTSEICTGEIYASEIYARQGTPVCVY